MTEKLYYADPRRTRFSARVLSCGENKGRFEVVLDRSAFFPEGGGQPGDRGALGGVRVLDVHERGGEIVHYCDGPLPEGGDVAGEVDWALRFARMQIHSAEHVVSGLAHREWGCENVGFHMTERSATLDFDRELDAQQLQRLERLANETVWTDLRVNVLFPTAQELERLVFRQKKELSGQIRLVEIPGVDLCACCAPHLASTGQIGLIRLVDAARHRGGVRITMLAGEAAWADAAAQGRAAAELSRLFSAPRDALAEAARRFAEEKEQLKYSHAELERRYAALRAEEAARDGELCIFEPAELSAAAMRSMAEALAARTGGVAAVFAGDDAGGWRYAVAAPDRDLRPWIKEFNAALRGRGGGSAEMAQGSAAATRGEIREYVYGKERR